MDYQEKYQVIKYLGEGAFGKAMLAKSKEDESKVVIKVVDLKDMDMEMQLKIIQEGNNMYALDNENIVKVHSFNFDKKKSNAVLIMDFAEGGDLNRVICEEKLFRRKLDEYQIITWFIEICKGVKYCHERTIIHRDLKPENIFLTKDNHVKIGDFGISKMLGKLKTTNTAIGTSNYMSPEAYYGKNYTFSTDIWSLGILLYELCLLEHPMDKYHLKLKTEYLEGKIPKLNDKKYSQKLSDLIEKMLNVDPTKRPTIDEIIKESEEIKKLSRYEGEMNNGVKEGKGKYYFDNGDKYDGEWKEGKMEGKGIYYYINGNKYDGEWVNEKKEGKGILYYSNGDKYDGEWKNNIKEGNGTYYYKNGNKYEGEWKEGKMEGKGIFFFSNGDKYDGEWKNNKKEGYGTYYYTNGATKKGNWINNEFQKTEF